MNWSHSYTPPAANCEESGFCIAIPRMITQHSAPLATELDACVCYYPEHCPTTWWADDARRMRALGITYVRIGEFAWSRIEPEPGRFEWDWLDRAIAVLGKTGLRVVLGTPTATPPKWLIDRHPDILPYDFNGRPRNFGSRRHYSFSSPVWWEETRRIVTAIAARYGDNDFVAGWQTDNEYGCR
jgi:beta-galactosidase